MLPPFFSLFHRGCFSQLGWLLAGLARLSRAGCLCWLMRQSTFSPSQRPALPLPTRSPPSPGLTHPCGSCRVCRFAGGEDAGSGDPAEPAAPRVRRPQPVLPAAACHGAGGHRCLRRRGRLLVCQPAPGREAALRPAQAVGRSRGEARATPAGFPQDLHAWKS